MSQPFHSITGKDTTKTPALFRAGENDLLLGNTYDSLNTYALAVKESRDRACIEQALRSLENTARIQPGLAALEWIRRLLLLALTKDVSSPTTTRRIHDLATPNLRPIRRPVVIVAGGCDARIEAKIQSYSHIILTAFDGFQGTILGGGTLAGTSGLVGEIQAHNGAITDSIGYTVQNLPPGITLDQRYKTIYHTQGTEFSALEPLQARIDLAAAGIRPSEVKVLGINGGAISGFEYRLALALGTTVGLIEHSDGAANALLGDPNWNTTAWLTRLSPNSRSIKAFLGQQAPQRR